MSKVPYTINVNEFVCTNLEQLRKMYETRDFSSMSAVIERIQMHVNAMEESLYVSRGLVSKIHSVVKDKNDEKSDNKKVQNGLTEEQRQEILKLIKETYPDNEKNNLSLDFLNDC